MTEPFTPEEARLAAALRAQAAVAVSELDGLAVARMVLTPDTHSRLPRVPRFAWLAVVLPVALTVALLAGLVAGMLSAGTGPAAPDDALRPSGDIAVLGAGISLVSLPNGSARWLDREGADAETELAFSPLGRDLAVLDVDRLRILDSVGDGPPRSFPGYSHMAGYNTPAWSPDGTRMALLDGVYEAESGGLVVLDLGTGTATPIRSDITDAALPAWSPDGEWIAFSTVGDSAVVRVVRPDGRDEARPIAYGYGSAWSPDGQRIATVTGPTRTDDSITVSVVDVASGDTVSVAPPPGTEGVRIFGWSPDGRELLCIDYTNDTAHIGFLDVPTGRWRHVATGSEPRLSPDGQWVAFVATLPGQPPAIRGSFHQESGVWVMDVLGTGRPNLVAPNVSYYGLAWRPATR